MRGADVKRGFGAEISSGLKWAVVLALVAYAAYLASQRSADELVELVSCAAAASDGLLLVAALRC